MIEVKVDCKDIKKHRIEVENALKEFKKLVKKENIMQELRRREYYVPPSRARRLKHEESLKQRKRDEKKLAWQNKNNEF